MNSSRDFHTSSIDSGLQISDLFFVHHRGSMNGLYMTMVMIGVRGLLR